MSALRTRHPPSEWGVVGGPLGAVVAVEAELAVAQLADGEEVALVALVVVGPELDVAGRPTIGRGHPADALQADADFLGCRHRRVGDATYGGASRVVGQGDDDVAGHPTEPLLEAVDHRVV